ncbi:hypothetical protein DNH61_16135 [Paenibacillus sambharensis]|uniref:Cobalamin-independent methionine synthase MetE N-terminal domain-containing protein n=1 Tax=Paenibacillus sambharensis TaxID=1803190 RepID=A0A2W1LIE9_9BACL|nr:hypothetical protein [Paenibacillus sambharensis]PZD94822.1 hypothetical protein DNH61_16135 [Paenibacillus sambharensis]
MMQSNIGTISNLGYPQIGEACEWKHALEQYWQGEYSETQLRQEMSQLRLRHLQKQRDAGVNWIPAGEFTWYDHVLDHTAAFGLIPGRYAALASGSSLDLYFAMARGSSGILPCDTQAWFGTAYRYIVPEWTPGQLPELTANPWLEAFEEAKNELGLITKPVLIGPYTFVSLSKGIDSSRRDDAVRSLLPLYGQILAALEAAGAEWVQLDEPALVNGIQAGDWKLVNEVYTVLQLAAPGVKLMLQTYFGAVDNYEALADLPCAGIGLDLVHDGGTNTAHLLRYGFPADKVLGAGIVDGLRIWRTDLTAALEKLELLLSNVSGERLILQPSCSLLHLPVTVKREKRLQGLYGISLSFADEKLNELRLLSTALREGRQAIKLELAENDVAVHALAAAGLSLAASSPCQMTQGERSSQQNIRKNSVPVIENGWVQISGAVFGRPQLPLGLHQYQAPVHPQEAAYSTASAGISSTG